MLIDLAIILIMILVIPFTFRVVEHNLEYFLFIMAILATIVSGVLSMHLIEEILSNGLLYFITAAVLIAGLVFRYSVHLLKKAINYLILKTSLKIFIFSLIAILGLISSFITAIISALILVEIVHALPLKHENKIKLTVISCFSIGLGAALTPIGEPLSTIVISTMDANFFYIVNAIGIYVIPCIFALAIFGAFYIDRQYEKDKIINKVNENEIDEESEIEEESILEVETEEVIEMEKLSQVFIRAFKIFIFIIALELLGSGFRPLINTYIIHLSSNILYWFNITSAVLDNATLAAAEVSPAMSLNQIQSILMGLLLSGGMLIPGNIPNIIAAGKLEIKSKEWAIVGLPIGGVLLLFFFVVMNLVH